tara:strand:- start:27156 stop:27515 length:360 start_codon:yes stop_codon:yes gene_type:complete
MQNGRMARAQQNQAEEAPLRQEVEQNYDADVADQIRNMKVYKYHKAMGGKLEGEMAQEAAKMWGEENMLLFNRLLEEDRASGEASQGFTADIKQGMNDEGITTTDSVDPDGTKVITLGR